MPFTSSVVKVTLYWPSPEDLCIWKTSRSVLLAQV